MKNRNYWCYRIDTNNIKFFVDELNQGRLRQGWGWDEKQDLRNFKMDEGAGRNRPMINNVKKGDKQYISPFIKNVGNCGGCRKLISTNDPFMNLPGNCPNN